jgi:hypothetical protein
MRWRWSWWLRPLGVVTNFVAFSFVILLAYYLFNLLMIIHSKIMVWNCRGEASTAFYRFCKQYASLHKPVMIVIMETRCEPEKLRRTFALLGFDGLCATDVNGFAGGIIVGWRKEDMKVQLVDKSFQYMHLKVSYKDGKDWLFTPIYVSPYEGNRKILWDALKSISNNMHTAWLLAGDFNDIASNAASPRRCNTFLERDNSCKLIDLGYVGSKYTWRGPLFHGGGRIFERLDRALCNDVWRLEFPEAYVKTLTRLDFSDHHPILICPFENVVRRSTRLFRFESAWHLNPSYRDMLQNCWRHEESVVCNLQKLQCTIKE